MALAVEVVTLVTQLTTLCNTILQIVSSLRALAETSIHSDIVALGARLKLYEDQIKVHGDHVNNSVVIILEKSKLTLLEVESKMSYLKEEFDNNVRCCCRLTLYAKLYPFSGKLDKAIKSVNRDLENISKIMEQEATIKSQFQQNADLLPTPTRILDNDSLYVPLEDTQSVVLTAIEDFGGPRIVLLHGGVGKGKSTLSRYVCQLYGKSGDKKNIFHSVFLVNCAGSSRLDPSNIQYEILRHLSPASLSIPPESKKKNFKDRIAKSLHDFFLSGEKMLIILDDVSDGCLISEMWKASEDGTQVRYLVTSQYPYLCDSFTTYTFPIAMGDPNEKEALQILASHVGLEDKVIPEKLQEIAAQMIKATERNPLALACLGGHLGYSRDKTYERAWKEAYKSLRHILDCPERLKVLGDDSPPKSLWAVMKICLDSLETGDAKNILFLMYACAGETVPEEVLRILHAATNTCSSGMFLKSIEELRSRELLRCNVSATAHKMNIHGNDTEDQQKFSTWSLSTIVKLYIKHHMIGEENMRPLYSALLGDDEINTAKYNARHEGCSETEASEMEKAEVAIALCALYFDENHTDETVAKAATQACKLSNIKWTATVKDLRRKALEPLIWLLDQLEEADLGWTESSIHWARQVFLRYTCYRELDENNIYRLLRLENYPSAQVGTLTTLAEILTIEEAPLLKPDSLTFLGPLVDLLSRHNIQEAASRAILGIAEHAEKDERKELSISILRSTPHLLKELVSALKDSLAHGSLPQPNSLARNAAETLWNLASGGQDLIAYQTSAKNQTLPTLSKSLSKDLHLYLKENEAGTLANLPAEQSSRLSILTEDGVIEGLLWALSKEDSPLLQTNAMGALGNLAAGPESAKRLIIDKDGVLAGLVRALSNKDNLKLQCQAATALANLAAGNSTGSRILEQDGVLEGLVAALSINESLELQTLAIGTLANLAVAPNSTQRKILDNDGVLPGLIRALSNESDLNLKCEAAMALANLAAGPESANLEIVRADGVLEGLVEAVSKEERPQLQIQAMRAIASLTSEPDSAKFMITNKTRVQRRIMDNGGVLGGLVRALSNKNNLELQILAAMTLANLAAVKSTELVILREHGVLDSLVGALSNNESLDLQTAALRALANFAAGPDAAKEKLLDKHGVLAGLVGALSKHQSPKLQEGAARVLANLASGESLQQRVLTQAGLLEGLVGALTTDEHRDLQTAAMRVFASLVRGPDSAKDIIVRKDGVLASLVRALSNDNKVELQHLAARTLAHLASGKSTQLRMLREPGLLDSLVRALSNDKSLEVQTIAIMVLANLAAGPESAKCIIISKDGILADLVRTLSKEQTPKLQEGAARVLANLACGESIQERVLTEAGVFEGLVGALSNEERPNLQTEAMRAFANFAAGPDAAKEKLLVTDGVLEGLVGALPKDQSPKLQEGAARVFADLARGESMQERILTAAGVLEGLLAALSNEERPDLQTAALRAFARLGAGPDSAKCIIVDKDGVLAGVVRALSNENNLESQYLGAMALANLAKGKSTRLKISHADGVLEGLVEAVSKDESRQLQIQAIRAIVSLTSERESAKYIITNKSRVQCRTMDSGGVLGGLVRALSNASNLELQYQAAIGLENLAAMKSTELVILRQDGVLDSLVGALSNDKSLEVQIIAIMALGSLAAGPESAKCIIVNKDGILADLVRTLSKEQTPKLQEGAARVLANLACGESMPERVLTEAGVLEGLVGALSNEESPDLQIVAMRALANFAAGPDAAKEKNLGTDGVLAGLVGALSKDQSPKLQKGAARVLANLACGESTHERILTEAGVLEGLVGALSNEERPDLQTAAMQGFASLVAGPDSAKCIIVDKDGVLAGLVGAMSNENNLELQNLAARTVAHLASGKSTQLRMLREPGLLDSLVGALSNDKSLEVQTIAIMALGSLAAGPESAKCIIINKDGILADLVRALSKEQSPRLQEGAARVLANLAHGESTRLRILSEAGVLKGLVVALLNKESLDLQTAAVRVFANLAAGTDAAKCKIVDKAGVLAGLVGALTNEDNPQLQEEAAIAIANLTRRQSMELSGLVAPSSEYESPLLQKSGAGTSNRLGKPEDCKIKLKMRSEQGLLAALARSAKQDHALLAEAAKQALQNLDNPPLLLQDLISGK